MQGSQSDDNFGYIVMELGEYNLSNYIEQTITARTAIDTAEQILKGIQHMHESCHIVHGNLKVSIPKLFKKISCEN